MHFFQVVSKCANYFLLERKKNENVTLAFNLVSKKINVSHLETPNCQVDNNTLCTSSKSTTK